MRDTMKKNWNQVCDQLKSNVESTPYLEEKYVLLKIERNVYHRKTASPIVIIQVRTVHAVHPLLTHLTLVISVFPYYKNSD